MKKYVLLLLLSLSAGVGRASQTTYVSSDFKGTEASGWTFVTGQGDGPALTAASGADPVGQGWLRLTKDVTNQSSFVYHNTPIPTAGGLIFTFDLVIWGAGRNLADGLTLAIFDAAATPAAGGYGGSLGYAQRTTPTPVMGLAGGIAGFGFDVFGNYSRNNEGRIGGPGQTPNSVAIRGSMGADRYSGYEYITGTGSLEAFSKPLAASRDQATIHTVRITIPTDRKVSVEWMEEGDLDWTVLIDQFDCNLTCPEEIRFGFTAGTGASSANQEIRNLSVTNIPEPASVLLIFSALAAGFWIRRRFAD